jgi:hypothetical protein
VFFPDHQGIKGGEQFNPDFLVRHFNLGVSKVRSRDSLLQRGASSVAKIFVRAIIGVIYRRTANHNLQNLLCGGTK